MSPRRKHTVSWIALAAALLAGVGALGARLFTPRAPTTAARANGDAAPTRSARTEPLALPIDPGSPDTSRSDIERASATGPEHEFVFTFVGGRPVIGATVAAFGTARLLDRDVTDANGHVHLACGERSTRLLIAGPNLAPDFRAVELASAPTRVELPGGVLAGVLRPLDARLDRIVSLELASDRPWFVDDGLPDAVRSAVQAEWLDPIHRTLQADAGGRFRFEGLSEPWSGTLRVGPECTLVAADPPAEARPKNRVRIGEARADLGLDVFQRPRLTGRVVDRAGGRGIGGLSVALMPRYAVTGGSPLAESDVPYLPTRTAADGSFAIWLPEAMRADGASKPSWPDLAAVSVRLREPGRTGHQETIRLAAEMRSSFDLGEFAFSDEVLEGVRFEVRARAGAPIRGATVTYGGHHADTDERGRVELERPLYGTPAANVAALGFRAARVDVPKASSEPIVVELAPTNRLHLRLRQIDGTPASGLRIALDRAAVFAAAVDDTAFAANVGLGVVEARPEASGDRVVADRAGELVLCEVNANVPIELVAVSAFEDELERFHVRLGPEERATFDLALTRPTSTLHCVVTDGAQRPLHDATLYLERGDSVVTLQSGADGTVEVPYATPGSVTFSIQKSGFAPSFDVERTVGVGDAHFHFTLLASRALQVRAEDRSGRGVPLDALRIAWDTAPEVLLQRLPASGYATDVAPREPARVEVQVAGATYARALGADESELVVPVPDHGRAEFQITFASNESRDAWTQRGTPLSVAVRDVDGNLAPQRAYFPFGSTAASLERLLPGDYQACFECSDADATRVPVRFRVVAEQTTNIALTP